MVAVPGGGARQASPDSTVPSTSIYHYDITWSLVVDGTLTTTSHPRGENGTVKTKHSWTSEWSRVAVNVRTFRDTLRGTYRAGDLASVDGVSFSEEGTMVVEVDDRRPPIVSACTATFPPRRVGFLLGAKGTPRAGYTGTVRPGMVLPDPLEFAATLAQAGCQPRTETYPPEGNPAGRPANASDVRFGYLLLTRSALLLIDWKDPAAPSFPLDRLKSGSSFTIVDSVQVSQAGNLEGATQSGIATASLRLTFTRASGAGTPAPTPDATDRQSPRVFVPSQRYAQGGTAHLSFNVSDNSGVARIEASLRRGIAGPFRRLKNFGFTKVSKQGRGLEHSVKFELTTKGTYQLRIVAVDRAGNQAEALGRILVY